MEFSGFVESFAKHFSCIFNNMGEDYTQKKKNKRKLIRLIQVYLWGALGVLSSPQLLFLSSLFIKRFNNLHTGKTKPLFSIIKPLSCHN